MKAVLALFFPKEKYDYTNNCAAAAAAKSLQSCPTLCDPIDGRQPTRLRRPWDSPARTLKWVAISFSSAWKWKVKVKSLSRVRLVSDPMDCSLPGSSVHGIFQARVLEWVAVAFSAFQDYYTAMLCAGFLVEASFFKYLFFKLWRAYLGQVIGVIYKYLWKFLPQRD